jgi:hypothetical protein
MPYKKQTFGLVPIPRKIHLSRSLQKNLFSKGVELSHTPFLTQKKPFWKRKKVPNPSSPFLKAPLITHSSFNLIELSTPYTHWNPIFKNKPVRERKKLNILTPLLSFNFHL